MTSSYHICECNTTISICISNPSAHACLACPPVCPFWVSNSPSTSVENSMIKTVNLIYLRLKSFTSHTSWGWRFPKRVGTICFTRASRSFSFRKTPITMVEGHQCHRVAHFHRQKLVGKKFTCSSPNGRCAEGATAINQKPLRDIQVHGKNLFYFFGDDDVIHIHFGMSGTFSLTELSKDGSSIVEPKPTTRLELKGHGLVGHVSAMTVQHGPLQLYHNKVSKLGEDPLRDDARSEAVWEVVRNSKKSIGLLLMDQSVIAGVGNIFRAEILFKSGIHPEQPGCTLTREEFDRVWFHSAELLQAGFRLGSIVTVDPSEGLPPPWTRRYIYNQTKCGRCGDRIRSWDIASRTAYACPTCQPLRHDSTPTERQAIVSKAKGAVEFVSHCAPDDENVLLLLPSRMTVAQLKNLLFSHGLSIQGKKADLVDRVLKHAYNGTIKKEEDNSADALLHNVTPGISERVTKKRRAEIGKASSQSDAHGHGGVARALDMDRSIVNARDAALEKINAGEKRSVEHVPLPIDDATTTKDS